MCRAMSVRPFAAALTLMAIVGSGISFGQQPLKPGPPSAEQLTGWVRQLDADEFLTRETATLQLLEAGPAALPALRPVLIGGSLEATSRGLYLLRQLSLAADDEAQDEAGAILAEAAARKAVPT